MKNKFISALMVPLVLSMGLMQTSCFGSFGLTKKMYGVVENIGPDDKVGGVIRTLIMYAGFIIPAWEVCAFVDIVILNLIEFWTGSNPIAMEDGEMEQQTIHYQGNEYLVTATKNQFQFQKIENGIATDESTLQFCDEDRSWSYIKNGESRILTAFRGVEDGTAKYDIYTAEGVKSLEAELSI